MKSAVELFWDKMKEHFGDTRDWNDLHPMDQHKIIQGINLILSTMKTGG